jgi:hypothetical protein
MFTKDIFSSYFNETNILRKFHRLNKKFIQLVKFLKSFSSRIFIKCKKEEFYISQKIINEKVKDLTKNYIQTMMIFLFINHMKYVKDPSIHSIIKVSIMLILPFNKILLKFV